MDLDRFIDAALDAVMKSGGRGRDPSPASQRPHQDRQEGAPPRDLLQGERERLGHGQEEVRGGLLGVIAEDLRRDDQEALRVAVSSAMSFLDAET
ncbi:MAG: hypothetical protein OWQ51_07970 [Pyrobaculum arsenaticum]|uniref:Uncharacterized protein n=1 Tax=Pyrobaculum arsenaticum (strain DSM 13514 / JCM 11321 / PZ6) TaxID=340102 RepID=A4WLC4_PYRAR|nr:hypothetical protein Pars_1638 [Pyrobaculum arsenaticum DSM 13514]MCY0890899.1 hypothetical protein [Pyrobaculum arsenaticum]